MKLANQLGLVSGSPRWSYGPMSKKLNAANHGAGLAKCDVDGEGKLVAAR